MSTAGASMRRSAAARAGFTFEDIDAFDDEALETFLDPADSGVDPRELGMAASGCPPAIVDRFARCLPASSAADFLGAARAATPPDVVAEARQQLLNRLLWPLVYWSRPDDYVELVRGEQIADRVLDELDLAGKVVCDIGAGAGRFTLAAARRCRHVIAVDAVPALLQRLYDAADRERLHNIETRRAAFRALPLADGSVDIAVACSSFTGSGPHGGVRAVREAERVTRRGGVVAIIWPQQPGWFVRRGYEHITVRAQAAHSFRDAATAARLCSLYYSAAAERWVRSHHAREVPYSILGVAPPNDVCIKLVR